MMGPLESIRVQQKLPPPNVRVAPLPFAAGGGRHFAAGQRQREAQYVEAEALWFKLKGSNSFGAALGKVTELPVSFCADEIMQAGALRRRRRRTAPAYGAPAGQQLLKLPRTGTAPPVPLALPPLSIPAHSASACRCRGCSSSHLAGAQATACGSRTGAFAASRCT